MGLEFRLLGAVRAYIEGRQVDLGGPRTRAVLAVLLLHPNQPIRREQLAEFAWPVRPTAGEDELIAISAQRLREALAPAGDQVELRAAAGAFVANVDPATVDVHRFLALLQQSGIGTVSPDFGPAARLRQAVELWQGQTTALADVNSPWLRDRAQMLEGLRLDVLERLARLELEVGHPERAVEHLRRLLLAEPASEPLITAQVLALIAVGDNVKAADLAERTRRELRAQGRLPGPSLVRAHSEAAFERARHAPTISGGSRYQLPATTRAFTGRGHELAELLDLATGTTGEIRPGVIGICAINGMAGVGKTALAVHAAHLVASRFPDGQLFVDLHGYTTGLSPLTPGEALASILQSFGIAPKQIPTRLDERAALYRDRLADTRTLIVLDNATSEAQVRPLLPGTGSCLVLVTSRSRLRGLDEGPSLTLDVLPTADAVTLFRAIAGSERTWADKALLEQIVERCGRLPLAVRIAAALLRHRPAWTLTDLAQKLAGPERARLTTFRDGERSLEAVFELSSATLAPAWELLFRRLGLIPGPSFDAYAAAALTGTTLAEAEAGLQTLVDHSLLAEPQPGRYRLHDLLRAYARTLIQRDELVADRTAALDRLLDYYQYAAQQADWRLARLPFTYAPPVTPLPQVAPAFSAYRHAADWMAVELANLTACVNTAATRPDPGHAVALAAAMQAYLRAHGPWTLATTLHTTAAAAAERSHDYRGQASALLGLGIVQIFVGDYSAAQDTLDKAVALCQQAGTEYFVRQDPGRRTFDDRPADIVDDLVRCHRRIGDLVVEANALAFLAAARWMSGWRQGSAATWAQASACQHQAAALFDSTGATAHLIKALRQPGDGTSGTDAVRAVARDCAVGKLRCRVAEYCYIGAAKWMTGDFIGVAHAFGTALDLHRRIDVLYRPGPPTRVAAGGRPFSVANKAGFVEQAMQTCRQTRDELGLDTIANLGGIRVVYAANADVVSAIATVVAYHRQVGNRLGHAAALTYQGEVLWMLGDEARSTSALEEAISIYRDIDQRGGEAEALCRYAQIFVQNEPDRAGSLYSDVLRIAREIASPLDEAEALEGLGEVRLRQNNTGDGIAYLGRALAIYRRLGVPKAQQVEARLSTAAAPTTGRMEQPPERHG